MASASAEEKGMGELMSKKKRLILSCSMARKMLPQTIRMIQAQSDVLNAALDDQTEQTIESLEGQDRPKFVAVYRLVKVERIR